MKNIIAEENSANICRGHCHSCPAHLDRRSFLKYVSCGVAAGALNPVSHAADSVAKPRVAVFFFSDPKPVENWPWPGWNPAQREKELSSMLKSGCSGVEFEFFSSSAESVKAGLQAKDRFDGVLAYLMTLGSSGRHVMSLAEWKKPMILANYVLGGCAPWLALTTRMLAAKMPVVCVSTERDSDLVSVACCFSSAKQLTAEQFAGEGWEAYRKTYGRVGNIKIADDPLKIT